MPANPGLAPNVTQPGVPLGAQVSPGAPMSNPIAQAPVPSDAQNMQGVRQQPQQGKPPSTESEIILKAMSDRLKADTKAKEQSTQPTPNAAPAMPAPAMGGGYSGQSMAQPSRGYAMGGGMNQMGGQQYPQTNRIQGFSSSPVQPIAKMRQGGY